MLKHCLQLPVTLLIGQASINIRLTPLLKESHQVFQLVSTAMKKQQTEVHQPHQTQPKSQTALHRRRRGHPGNRWGLCRSDLRRWCQRLYWRLMRWTQCRGCRAPSWCFKPCASRHRFLSEWRDYRGHHVFFRLVPNIFLWWSQQEHMLPKRNPSG